MKVSVEQFLRQISDKSLAPIYWLSGDEPLQLQECHQALLVKAQQQGFSERQRLDAKSLDAGVLHEELYATSLLSAKRILEITLTQGKLTETLNELLLRYTQKLNMDVLLVLLSAKLEANVTQSRAFKALDQVGIVLQCWPMPIEQLPRWFAARLAKYQLSTSPAGLNMLADLTEGNLLYAAQSIEKLALLFPEVPKTLTPDQILAAVAPQVHFDTFQLNEAFLLGDKLRALKICRNLRATGVEIILVWGALLKDIRLLLKLSSEVHSAQDFADACQRLGVWEKRRPLYRKALQRGCHNIRMLQTMGEIDQLIKNSRAGDPWLALERFILKFI